MSVFATSLVTTELAVLQNRASLAVVSDGPSSPLRATCQVPPVHMAPAGPSSSPGEASWAALQCHTSWAREQGGKSRVQGHFFPCLFFLRADTVGRVSPETVTEQSILEISNPVRPVKLSEQPKTLTIVAEALRHSFQKPIHNDPSTADVAAAVASPPSSSPLSRIPAYCVCVCGTVWEVHAAFKLWRRAVAFYIGGLLIRCTSNVNC